MKSNPKVVSVIDIGSSFLRLGIYQWGKTKMQMLDMLTYPLRIGHETFTNGQICAQTVRELTTALRGFSRVMKEYGVENYRAIATTALREAKNRPFVIDQLKTQNNLMIDVLEDGKESALIYSELLRMLPPDKSALLSYIGTGSVGVAAVEKGKILRSSNTRLGFLKLGDVLRGLEDQTTHFHLILEEYVDAYFRRLERPFGMMNADQLVLAGRELETIAPLCGARLDQNIYRIERERFEDVYDQVKNMSTTAVATQFEIDEEIAERLLPMLTIYRKIIHFTNTKEIIAPKIDIMDVLAKQMLDPMKEQMFATEQQEGALSCARETAAAHHVDKEHAQRVEEYASLLFERLRKLHGISSKWRTILCCAAQLHEIGEDLNVKDIADATYDLIRQSYFFGLSEEETVLLAEIAKQGNEHDEFDCFSADFLSENQKLFVDKLAAILMLANTLDESHRGKIKEIRLKLDEKTLTVIARGTGELLLEKWAFEECAPFFEEVFGVKPVLVKKSDLIG